MGLMQLMPGTWRDMRAAYRLGVDLHDPRDNILAGPAYLSLMHERFGYPGLFGAYNVGPARNGDHLSSGRRLPGQTVLYMATVMGGTPAMSSAASSWRATGPDPFVTPGEAPQLNGSALPLRLGSSPMFVRLSTDTTIPR
jgi:hypothetical protein